MAAASPPRAAAGGTLSAVQDKENLDDAFAQLLPTPATIDKRPADASPGSSPAKKRRPLQSRIVFAPAGTHQGSIEKEPAAAVLEALPQKEDKAVESRRPRDVASLQKAHCHVHVRQALARLLPVFPRFSARKRLHGNNKNRYLSFLSF
jgi:hypothetical protein